MLKSCKAQSAQFNWIFIIFAGALVLAFFTVFVFKYVELENQKTNLEVLRTVEGNINVLESSGSDFYCDTSISRDCLSLGLKTNLGFVCFEDQTVLKINDQYLEVKDKIVFMPKKMNTNNLGFWIKAWNFPYFVSNIIYIAQPERKFYFVGGYELVEMLEMPEIFDYEVVANTDNVEKESVVVFLDKKPLVSEINSLKQKAVKVLYVNKNQVSFFEEKEKKINYVSNELLIGAFFVDDYVTYKCVLDKAKERVKMVSEVYYHKTQLLTDCIYSELGNTIRLFEKNYGLKDSLIEQNNDFIGRGCASVF